MLLKDLKENETEKIALEQLHGNLLNSLQKLKGKKWIKIQKFEIIERLENQLSSLDVSLKQVQHQEELNDREVAKTRGRLLGMKVSAIEIHRKLHEESSKFLLYKRLKLRRQKKIEMEYDSSQR